MNVDGRVAIVTGASRGIGKAIALGLAGAGARVVVAARTTDPGGRLPGTIHETAQAIQARGGQALAVPFDVTDEASVDVLVARTQEEWGQVDILVNNAGVLVYSPIAEMPVKRWDLLMRVNVRGAFLCTRAVLPGMIERHAGSIINLTSWAGHAPYENGIAYGTTKAALEYFTLGLADEVKPYNVAVNALTPEGHVDTEGARLLMPGLDRSDWEPPELLAEAAVFLAGCDAQSLTGRVIVSREWKRLQAGTPYPPG